MATTVVNATPANESTNNGSGFLLGVVLFIVFIGALLYYGVPYLQSSFHTGAQVNVPDHVNVNIQQKK